jgi:PAS domain S-box-containing protein
MFGKDKENRKSIDELALNLRACEARFHNVIMRSDDGFVIVDESGVIRFVNPAAAALFTTSGHELVGESFGFPIVAGETTELDIVRKGAGIIAEMRVTDTEWDGSPARLLILRDITDRRRAEKELRMMYRAVLESPGMAMITDPRGLIEFVNPKFTEVTGYSLPEVAGKDPGFLKSGQEPADVYQELRDTIRTGREWRGELISRKKSGELFWQSVAISPITDFDGHIVNFVGVMEDVTERKKSEEALRRSEKKFAALFGATPALLAVSSLKDGKIIEVNDKVVQTLGFTRQELLGATSMGLGIWVDPADRDDILRTLFDGGKVRERECVIRGKTGEIFQMLLSAEIIEIDSERCMLSMVSDITDRKQAKEKIEKLNSELATRAAELEAANRELEAFNYTVAHDLRKPLTAVNGYCQAIRELCADRLGEQCSGFLQEAYDGTLRMNRLIDVLLNLSRLSHVEPRRELVDLSDIARQTSTELRLTAPDRRVTFRIADGISAEGDASLLRVVLDNLLGNAWKYTARREEAVIEFGAADSGGTTAYFVCDNGTGFDKEEAPSLFIPFRRLHDAAEWSGYGIGLATVERIIRRHGGKAWAEGEPDKGACFRFTLSR